MKRPVFLHSVSMREVYVRKKIFSAVLSHSHAAYNCIKKENTPLYVQCYEKLDLSIVASAVL